MEMTRNDQVATSEVDKPGSRAEMPSLSSLPIRLSLKAHARLI